MPIDHCICLICCNLSCFVKQCTHVMIWGQKCLHLKILNYTEKLSGSLCEHTTVTPLLSSVSPSVSCRSSTLRICDSGISAMCLSGGGGLVCPSGLLNVLITLCRFLAICPEPQIHTNMYKIKLPMQIT